MVSTLFRDPQALSSALAALGTLQPRAFGSLNRVETLDSASNYYDGKDVVKVVNHSGNIIHVTRIRNLVNRSYVVFDKYGIYRICSNIGATLI